MTASSMTSASAFCLKLGSLSSLRRSVPGNTFQPEMNHVSANGHRICRPCGLDESTEIQSTAMCDAHARAQSAATRTTWPEGIGRTRPVRQAINAATAATRTTDNRLCVAVRWNPLTSRSKSGAAASATHVSVRAVPVLPAKRLAGRISAPQTTARPARAWPIGLAIKASMMADSATCPRRGESR